MKRECVIQKVWPLSLLSGEESLGPWSVIPDRDIFVCKGA